MADDRAEARNPWSMHAIGVVRSPYREKFGIPRQPGLVDVESRLCLLPGYDLPEMVEGLDGFSHLWLTFVFHACVGQGWRPRVRPPRLGGNERVGVYASRAPFRPNHLGLSVVRLLGIDTDGGLSLRLAGADLLDGTPVLDIKPYVPYVDSVPDARAGFAPQAPSTLDVVFSPAADSALLADPPLKRLIGQVLSQDPRPAYQEDDGARVYGVKLANMNVRFRISAGVAEVLGVEALDDGWTPAG